MLSCNVNSHLIFDVLKKKTFSWLIFVGLGLIIGAVPFFGPFLIKIVTIPIFWILNALGYIISAVAIKKGYATELAKSRMITLAMLIGIIIGYITGNIIPLQKWIYSFYKDQTLIY